jgi:hypothetical protein
MSLILTPLSSTLVFFLPLYCSLQPLCHAPPCYLKYLTPPPNQRTFIFIPLKSTVLYISSHHSTFCNIIPYSLNFPQPHSTCFISFHLTEHSLHFNPVKSFPSPISWHFQSTSNHSYPSHNTSHPHHTSSYLPHYLPPTSNTSNYTSYQLYTTSFPTQTTSHPPHAASYPPHSIIPTTSYFTSYYLTRPHTHLKLPPTLLFPSHLCQTSHHSTLFTSLSTLFQISSHSHHLISLVIPPHHSTYMYMTPPLFIPIYHTSHST